MRTKNFCHSGMKESMDHVSGKRSFKFSESQPLSRPYYSQDHGTWTQNTHTAAGHGWVPADQVSFLSYLSPTSTISGAECWDVPHLRGLPLTLKPSFYWRSCFPLPCACLVFPSPLAAWDSRVIPSLSLSSLPARLSNWRRGKAYVSSHTATVLKPTPRPQKVMAGVHLIPIGRGADEFELTLMKQSEQWTSHYREGYWKPRRLWPDCQESSG